MTPKSRNPNITHPIHGPQGAAKISRPGPGSLPLDLMNEAGLKRSASGGLDPFWRDLLQAARRQGNGEGLGDGFMSSRFDEF